MKRAAFAVILALFILYCGNDKPTGNNSITMTISPTRLLIDLGASFQFSVFVYGTDNYSVTWSVNGSPDNGIITQSGNYTAPSILPVNADSVRITARLNADSTISASAWAVLVDPSRIYVSSLGSDSTGVGSSWQPYRTITRALTGAHSGQMIIVGSGQYDMAVGERFPLRLATGIIIQGAGQDSTFVIGPGAADPERDATFLIDGFAVTIERLSIRSVNSRGVGISVRSGRNVEISNNEISQNRIGIYAFGPLNPRPIFESNIIMNDSIGVVMADSSGPFLRNNTITNCPIYGVEIRDFGQPDLGRDDSTNAGDNTIRDCGDGCHWLIYNSSPNSIWAVGNTFPFGVPQSNDVCIWDDEESGGLSGDVILTHP